FPATIARSAARYSKAPMVVSVVPRVAQAKSRGTAATARPAWRQGEEAPGRKAVGAALAEGVPVSWGSTAMFDASPAAEGLPLGKSLLMMVQAPPSPMLRLELELP